MATTILNNQAVITGLYDLIPTTLNSLAVATQMVDGLTITKTADQEVWVSGLLTYTIVIENNADKPYTGVELTDVLDVTKIALVANSVQVDGATAAYTYGDVTGSLTVNLPDIAVGGSSTVTFQVSKE